MDYRAELLTLSAAYCGHTGLSEARVATLVQNSGEFFDRIRAGKTCTVDTFLKAKHWFAFHWPEGLEWPEGVSRPDIIPTAHPGGHQPPAARSAAC